MGNMKKSIIYISVLFAAWLLISSTASAQSLKAGEYTVNGIRFKVYESKEKTFFGIVRANRPFIPENKETINGIASYYVRPTLTNKEAWQQMTINILGNQRVAALKQNKERLNVRFFVKPNGEIYYMAFRVTHNSILTLQEIVKIEQVLLKKYKMALKSDNNAHLQLAWIMINSELDFSKL